MRLLKFTIISISLLVFTSLNAQDGLVAHWSFDTIIFNQFIEGFQLLGAAIINIFLIFLYPILGILEIKKAKKEMRRNRDRNGSC